MFGFEHKMFDPRQRDMKVDLEAATIAKKPGELPFSWSKILYPI